MYAVNLCLHSSYVAWLPSYVGGLTLSLCVAAKAVASSSASAAIVVCFENPPVSWDQVLSFVVWESPSALRSSPLLCCLAVLFCWESPSVLGSSPLLVVPLRLFCWESHSVLGSSPLLVVPLLLFCGESPSVLGSSPLLVLPLLCVGIMGSSPLLCLLIAVAWRCSWLGRAGLSCKIHSSCRQCLSLLLQCCTRMFSLCWALGSCLEPNVVERLVNCAQVCWSTVHLLVYQHECMYVSIYVCMYVCIYVCVYVYTITIYTWTYLPMFVVSFHMFPPYAKYIFATISCQLHLTQFLFDLVSGFQSMGPPILIF